MSAAFWPKNLVPVKEDSIASSLRVQAAALPDASGGLLMATVEQQVLGEVFRFVFRVRPRGNREASYDLFAVNAPGGSFPVAVVANHLDEQLRVRKAEDIGVYEAILESLLTDRNTVNVLQLLSEVASRNEAGDLDDPQVFLAAGAMQSGNGVYTAASFFGVHTFIALDEVRRLADLDDSKTGVYVPIDSDRTVVTVAARAGLKMTLSSEDARALKRMARLCLKNWENPAEASSPGEMPVDDR